MNQKLNDQLGHLKRENTTLNKSNKLLKEACITQQHELNKLRSQVKRIREITKE